jgi:hypothetical protein
MGAWGTGISSNDTYADIYDQFVDLYNDGLSVSEITKRLIDENKETINIAEDAPNFWFAIANAQWECKALDKEIFSNIVNTTKKAEAVRKSKETTKKGDIKSKIKTLDPKTKKRVEKVLQTKIKNPETGNIILVKSALKYDDTQKVKKLAVSLVKQAMKK